MIDYVLIYLKHFPDMFFRYQFPKVVFYNFSKLHSSVTTAVSQMEDRDHFQCSKQRRVLVEFINVCNFDAIFTNGSGSTLNSYNVESFRINRARVWCNREGVVFIFILR